LREEGGRAGQVLDGAQGGTVHDLSRARSRLFERVNCVGGILNISKIELTCVATRVIRQCVQNALGNESECAFGTDEQVNENIERSIEIKKGVQQIAVVIFHLITAMDFLRQFFTLVFWR
jgi:hypothetical protein